MLEYHHLATMYHVRPSSLVGLTDPLAALLWDQAVLEAWARQRPKEAPKSNETFGAYG